MFSLRVLWLHRTKMILNVTMCVFLTLACEMGCSSCLLSNLENSWAMAALTQEARSSFQSEGPSFLSSFHWKSYLTQYLGWRMAITWNVIGTQWHSHAASAHSGPHDLPWATIVKVAKFRISAWKVQDLTSVNNWVSTSFDKVRNERHISCWLCKVTEYRRCWLV